MEADVFHFIGKLSTDFKSKIPPAGCIYNFDGSSFSKLLGGQEIKGLRWIHWTMDLYPQAFIANGLVASGNLFVKFYRYSLKMHKPDHLICLGPAQREFINAGYYHGVPSTILPAGLRSIDEKLPEPGNIPEWYEVNRDISHCFLSIILYKSYPGPTKILAYFSISQIV